MKTADILAGLKIGNCYRLPDSDTSTFQIKIVAMNDSLVYYRALDPATLAETGNPRALNRVEFAYRVWVAVEIVDDEYDAWADECAERVANEPTKDCSCAPVQLVPGYPEPPCDACLADGRDVN